MSYTSSPTTPRAYGGASVLVKQAAALVVFGNGIAVFVTIEGFPDKSGDGDQKKLCNFSDFILADINSAGVARAASAASAAFKKNAVIKKI